MGSNQHASDAGETPALVPLAEALKRYQGVSVRVGRELIKSAKLPATRVGREYLVSPADVAALLAPRLLPGRPRKIRESETQRIERQLREAGIA